MNETQSKTPDVVIDLDGQRVNGYVLNLDENIPTISEIVKRQKTTLLVSKVILILVLLLILMQVLLSSTNLLTKQVGLVALIDVPSNSLNIPDYDPNAITPPNDDKVQKLNEKLDKGKMCINMVSKVTFENCYTAAYVNILNDEANNYPQFVTITLDSNGTQLYQSGLVEVGKSIPYAMLEVELPAGEYKCTATFTQVDPSTNSVCGQAAAKVNVTILE